MTGTDVDNVIGSVLAGRFRVSAVLGRGGMATVYLASDESLGRSVAVKVFHGDLADADDLQRQQDEIQLLATLNHPGLVTLFDATTDSGGNVFLVMELVEGSDLHTRLREGPLPSVEVASIGHILADALVYVHSNDVIHRDIKPGNILLPQHSVEYSGQPAKLADFGIARIVDGARLTATGKILGTASYFSPEQALGDPLTPASDIYSLGLVLLECLTGERAFPGSAVESMTARLARDPDVPAGLDDSWVGLLKGMTHRAPEARPTARDVAGVLARLADTGEATQPYQAATDGQTKVYTSVNAPASVLTEKFTRPGKTVRPEKIGRPEKKGRPEKPNGAMTGTPRRRAVLLIAAIAAALLLAWPATLAVSSMLPPSEPEAVVDYPAVDGTLGTHLEQLQRSVEP
jgi:serine/threonine protein kinase